MWRYKERRLIFTPSPPTWNGLTPGETTFSDADRLIQSMDGLDMPETLYDSNGLGQFNKVYYLRYQSSKEVVIYFIDDVVALIDFWEINHVPIKDVITTFGSPESITFLYALGSEFSFLPSQSIYPVFYILYPSKGIIAGGGLFHGEQNLKPTLRISEFSYFDPKLYETLLDAGMLVTFINNDKSNIHFQWRGYGELKSTYPEFFDEKN
jgi:hypothetical protein